MLIELWAALAWAGEATVSLDGRVWADLKTVGEAAEASALAAQRGPGPWVARREVWVTPEGDELRVDATWTVMTAAPGLFSARLSTGLEVAAVEVDGRSWGASLGRGAAPIESLSVPVAGRTLVHLTGLVRPGADGIAAFDLLAGPGPLRLPDGLSLASLGPGAAAVGEGWITSTAALRVGPAPEAPDAEAQVLMTGRSALGVTVGDGELVVRARVVWALRRGQVRTVSLRVPGAGADLTVTGDQVASFERSGDRVDVQLTGPADSAVTVALRWSAPIAAGTQVSATLPEVSPLGVLSVERVVSVARDTDVEVVPRFDRGEALALEAVPAWADGLISGTPTAARRGDVSGRLDLLRFVPADRPPLVVDVAEWFVAATEEGRTLAQGTLTVRNERASALRVGLRPGATLLAVQVEGQPVAAIRDGEGWRIPLPRSVETMRGLLSFPVELTVLAAGGPAWADGGLASVVLPSVDAEVAVRRVTVHLPRAVRALGEDGEGGRVDAFSEGEGLAYGFAPGVDQARASALYQEALGAWMQNDFDAAQDRLDALRALGGENENVSRLQSNLDLVDGDAAAAGDELLARRLKDQARARALDEEQAQAEVLRYADEQLAAGKNEDAAQAYAAAAVVADKLARLEQSESQDQRQRSREAKKKEAEAYRRTGRGSRAASEGGVAGGVLGGSLGGMGMSGMGQGGGGYGAVGELSAGAGSPLADAERRLSAWLAPAQDLVESASPRAPELEADAWWEPRGDSPAPEAAPLVDAPAAPPMTGDALGFDAEEVDVQGVRLFESTTRLSAARGPARPAAEEGRLGRRDAPGPAPREARVDGGRAGAFAAGGSAAIESDKPADAWEPLEVTATSAAVVVPALGASVRFQHLILPPGADVPVTVRVDLPGRFR